LPRDQDAGEDCSAVFLTLSASDNDLAAIKVNIGYAQLERLKQAQSASIHERADQPDGGTVAGVLVVLVHGRMTLRRRAGSDRRIGWPGRRRIGWHADLRRHGLEDAAPAIHPNRVELPPSGSKGPEKPALTFTKTG
jgi:hypothetical protein